MPENTKPIKRSVQLRTLSHEHHDGLLFSWKIRQGLGNGTDPEILREFTFWAWQNHFKPHFEQEEKILLPYIAGHPFADQLKKEHEDIRDLIQALNKNADRSLFSILTTFLDNHIRFEERHLFGYIENVLSQDQLDVIAGKLADHRVCSKEWENEFWAKKKGK